MSDPIDSESEPKPIQARGPGRPRAAEPGSRLTTWIPGTTHDRLIALANRRGESVSALVRQLLILRLR